MTAFLLCRTRRSCLLLRMFYVVKRYEIYQRHPQFHRTHPTQTKIQKQTRNLGSRSPGPPLIFQHNNQKFLTVCSTASDFQPKFCLMSIVLGTPCSVATALGKTSTHYYSKILNLLKIKENTTTFRNASCNKTLPNKIINFPFFFCQKHTGNKPYL